MVIIPKEKPVIENLNSFYIDINRLLEHYQGEMVSGGIFFKSISAEGAVFFDNNAVLGSAYQNADTRLAGGEAIERIISDCRNNNFNINIYEVDPARIYYWSNIPSAQCIYDNLSTEFTDLQGLMKKMGKENLTGYIEVDFTGGKKQAWIFFHNGMIIGGLDSWEHRNLDRSGEYLKRLITQTKSSGGTFHVCKVAMEPAPAPESGNILEPLEDLLNKFEDQFKKTAVNDGNFERDFRQKLVDNADRFAFLDPFAGEFSYSGRQLSYEGEAGDKELIKGTLTCIAQLAKEKGILDTFKDQMTQFLRNHGHGVKIDGLK